MKLLLPALAGNDALKTRLAAGLTSSPPALNHAYIIEGVRGSGKHTLARGIAAALCCENRGDPDMPLPCGKCETCRKIAAGISPDVTEPGREGDRATLGVDSIRGLRRDVHIFPNELEYKIYIVNDAHTMTPQAQNAFLLTLEEPPSYAVFLLLCETTQTLLETVRSRAPVLRMQPLTPEQTAAVVLAELPAAGIMRKNDPQGFDGIIMASEGVAGRAIELIGGREGAITAAKRDAAVNFCGLCADTGAGARVLLSLCECCTGSRDTALSQLGFISSALRDLVALKRAGDAPLRFFTDRDAASALSDRFPIRRLLTLCDAVRDAADALGRNMNVRLTLVSLVSRAGYLD